ncbi:hypothetical protein HMPREF3037_00943 [Candidatus Stoquefichus sp. KLE1796]|nr:hypothetical protein HMPREF3037_00943 [Candidatus Stoquefichus sp. KLE1796]
MIDTRLSQNYLKKEKKTHQAFITTFTSFHPSSYQSLVKILSLDQYHIFHIYLQLLKNLGISYKTPLKDTLI